ncbi:MAG: enoyl-CoA hydratase/isomerase family protein [Chloroflexi bacterium]|nr:enoyl-CoA hydratase/isomerase family protein [Chloroflexota bacterium]
MLMADTVLVDKPSKGVLLLTMNTPENLNALNDELMTPLLEELHRFETDRELRAVVITGAGRAFSSGANVKGFARNIQDREKAAAEPPKPTPWEQLDPIYYTRETRNYGTGPAIVSLLHNMQKPSFAAVNGHAYGLGCGIALSADFRIACPSSRFNEAFIRNGIVPRGSCRSSSGCPTPCGCRCRASRSRAKRPSASGWPTGSCRTNSSWSSRWRRLRSSPAAPCTRWGS